MAEMCNLSLYCKTNYTTGLQSTKSKQVRTITNEGRTQQRREAPLCSRSAPFCSRGAPLQRGDDDNTRGIGWARAPIKIAMLTLTINIDGNWNSFQLANSAPPLSVTDSAIAPSARMHALPFHVQAHVCRSPLPGY